MGSVLCDVHREAVPLLPRLWRMAALVYLPKGANSKRGKVVYMIDIDLSSYSPEAVYDHGFDIIIAIIVFGIIFGALLLYYQQSDDGEG